MHCYAKMKEIGIPKQVRDWLLAHAELIVTSYSIISIAVIYSYQKRKTLKKKKKSASFMPNLLPLKMNF